MKTKIINLIGSPGTGKSTITAELFAKLKWMGYDSEIVPEYAKDLTWEKRGEALKNQRYIFGKQHHRAFRVNNQVEFIITDCPLLLNIQYERMFNPTPSKIFEQMVLEEMNKQDNLNILLTRTKAYNPNGRNQTEEESNQIAEDLQNLMVELNQEFINAPAKENETVLFICNHLRNIGLLDTNKFIDHLIIDKVFTDGDETVVALNTHSSDKQHYIFYRGIIKNENVVAELDVFLSKFTYK